MAISVLQHKRHASSGSPASMAITVSAGSAIIAVVISDTPGTPVVSDGVNTWTGDLGTVANVVRGHCYAAYNVASGTVTVTATQSGAFLGFELLEVAGLATASAFDVFKSANGTSAASDTGVSLTTAQSDEISVSGVFVSTNTTVADNGSGYTYVDTASQDFTAGYLVLAATGTQEAKATLGASVGWAAALWTFKGAGGGGGSTVTSPWYYQMMQHWFEAA